MRVLCYAARKVSPSMEILSNSCRRSLPSMLPAAHDGGRSRPGHGNEPGKGPQAGGPRAPWRAPSQAAAGAPAEGLRTPEQEPHPFHVPHAQWSQCRHPSGPRWGRQAYQGTSTIGQVALLLIQCFPIKCKHVCTSRHVG